MVNVNIRHKVEGPASITESAPALRLFCDRYDVVRLFLTYLNDEPKNQILFLHGDGGNGKSLLLRYLQKYCSRQFLPDNWAWVKDKPNDEFMVNVVNATQAAVSAQAILDFGMPPRGHDRPQEAFSALLMLRRALGKREVRFPIFDFASIWYLHQTNQLEPERLKTLFPSEDLDVATELLKLIKEVPGVELGKAIFNLVTGKLRQRFTLYLSRRNIETSAIERIQEMEPESELFDNFPRFFAEDLNVATGKGTDRRIILFFDTHEAFWGGRRDLSDYEYFQRDEWVRCLLRNLDLGSGIVVVMAGREPPRWSHAAKEPVASECLQHYHIGHLSDSDAHHYLNAAGVEQPSVRERLICLATVRANEVHPLYLGLCADVALAASQAGQTLESSDLTRNMESADAGLTQRLLRYVDQEPKTAVYSLSACRAFDFKVYLALGRALHFQATEAAFRTLTAFSFVWRIYQNGEGQYRIHDLLRKILRDEANESVRRADETLENYYRTLAMTGDPSAKAESIYHACQLDWKNGIREWATEFGNAIQESKYEICRALLALRGELRISEPHERGLAAKVQGDYFSALARYEEAEQEYLLATKELEQALQLSPEDMDIQNQLGLSLLTFGDLQSKVARHLTAGEYYRRAVVTFDVILGKEPGLIPVCTNKSLALKGLADIAFASSHHKEAEALYRQAIAPLDTILERANDSVPANWNKAFIQRRLGDLEVELSQYEKAAQDYCQSVAAAQAVLGAQPDNVAARNNKGMALVGLARAYRQLRQHESATGCLQQAITTLTEAVKLSEDDVGAHNNLGLAFRGLADLLWTTNQSQEAEQTYGKAISAFLKAVKLAPNDVDALNNLAGSYVILGSVYANLEQIEQATSCLRKALDACQRALQHAPEGNESLTIKARALMQQGQMHQHLGHFDSAANSYRNALMVLEDSLQNSQEDVMGLINKQLVLRNLGGLEARQGQYDAAAQHYRAAEQVLSHALELAPDDLLLLSSRATTCSHLGSVLKTLGSLREAGDSLKTAIDDFSSLLTRQPDNVQLHYDKAITHIELGDLSDGNQEKAQYQRALQELDSLLQLVPGHEHARTLRDGLKKHLANHRSS